MRLFVLLVSLWTSAASAQDQARVAQQYCYAMPHCIALMRENSYAPAIYIACLRVFAGVGDRQEKGECDQLFAQLRQRQ